MLSHHRHRGHATFIFLPQTHVFMVRENWRGHLTEWHPLTSPFCSYFSFHSLKFKKKKKLSTREAHFLCCLSHRLYASHVNDGIFKLQSLLQYIYIKHPRPSLPWPTWANNSLVYGDHDLSHFQVSVASSGWARKYFGFRSFSVCIHLCVCVRVHVDAWKDKANVW